MSIMPDKTSLTHRNLARYSRAWLGARLAGFKELLLHAAERATQRGRQRLGHGILSGPQRLVARGHLLRRDPYQPPQLTPVAQQSSRWTPSC